MERSLANINVDIMDNIKSKIQEIRNCKKAHVNNLEGIEDQISSDALKRIRQRNNENYKHENKVNFKDNLLSSKNKQNYKSLINSRFEFDENSFYMDNSHIKENVFDIQSKMQSYSKVNDIKNSNPKKSFLIDENSSSNLNNKSINKPFKNTYNHNQSYGLLSNNKLEEFKEEINNSNYNYDRSKLDETFKRLSSPRKNDSLSMLKVSINKSKNEKNNSFLKNYNKTSTDNIEYFSKMQKTSNLMINNNYEFQKSLNKSNINKELIFSKCSKFESLRNQNSFNNDSLYSDKPPKSMREMLNTINNIKNKNINVNYNTLTEDLDNLISRDKDKNQINSYSKNTNMSKYYCNEIEKKESQNKYLKEIGISHNNTKINDFSNLYRKNNGLGEKASINLFRNTFEGFKEKSKYNKGEGILTYNSYLNRNNNK